MPYFSHVRSFAGDRLVDEHMPEFIRCKCFAPSAEVLRLQDQLAIALDVQREPAAMDQSDAA